MSFKLSNISFEQSRRIVKETIMKNDIEYINSTATSNPYISATEASGGTYTITLPNAITGTQKIITLVDNGTVTISYNSGYSGTNSTYTLGTRGDSIIFWANFHGWHTRTFID